MKKILGKILIACIVLLATACVIYYAKGYRINFTDNTVIQTGIAHIETQPSRANYYITEEFRGRTPRVVTSIPKGKYKLDVWLEDYHSVEYNIEIFAEKSTPISIFLFKNNPEKEVIKEIEKGVIDIHIDNSRNSALILVEAEGENEKQKDYEILRYQTNTRFWHLGENPSSLFTFSIAEGNEIREISIAPSSKNLLLNIIGQDEITQEDLLPTGKHLISLDTQTILANIEEITEEIKWSHDGESIIWLDNQGIKKLNLKEPNLPKLIYTPTKNTEILFYDAYTNGEVFVLYKTNENSFVSLSKVSAELDEVFLIEEIYYQNEIRFLENFKENKFIEYQPFTSSPQSTLFVGQPNEFLISKDTQTVIFNTEFASYIYDIEKDKYALINPYKTKILTFSPDGEKVSFLSLENQKLGYFIFDKEINNHSISLGGGYMDNYIEQDRCSDFVWHSNSQNFYYVCDNSLYVADIRTDYNLNLVQNFGKNIMFENTRKILTIENETNGLTIIEFTIN